ncbi:MAG: hypothetical protein QXM93_04565 [Candidatus Methanomethyliaceae archaeon]
MEGMIVSRYIREDTAEVLRALCELAKRQELWSAIKDVLIEYTRAEQEHIGLVKSLTEQDVDVLRTCMHTYPELLRITENALRIRSFWPFGVMKKAEKARELAHKDMESFLQTHKELQEKKLILVLEAQKKRLENMKLLFEGLRSLAVSLQNVEESQPFGMRNDDRLGVYQTS